MGSTGERQRGQCLEVDPGTAETKLSTEQRQLLSYFDALYRSLCAMLYNYVPTSGHPGGAVSCGRIVANLVWRVMDYDLAAPDHQAADQLIFAAGHKALGLYAMWALRDEVATQFASDLLAKDPRDRLRLEDLLGFRRNPECMTPLRQRYRAKALDGHPTPATPFVPLTTGASGVGLCGATGLALGLKDYYGSAAPRVHVLEGEGGLTPGRVSEALASAASAGLDNLLLHVDWNQASIDSDRVCSDESGPGEYVQWDPKGLLALNGWNVILVSDGSDWPSIDQAQAQALSLANGRPSAVVYRTQKGWRYGLQGRLSHGSGHPLCSQGFYLAVAEALDPASLPSCSSESGPACAGPDSDRVREACFWQALSLVRNSLSASPKCGVWLGGLLRQARSRLQSRGPRPRRKDPPQPEAIWEEANRLGDQSPPGLVSEPGGRVTLRGALGRALAYYNQVSKGAIFLSAADLLDSTSISQAGRNWPGGLYQAQSNPDSRLFAAGGICEDNMAGMAAGLTATGRYLGIGSSYAAFMVPLGHISARLQAIAQQGRLERTGQPGLPMVMVCAHAGLKTGEDGPTHADPQALQLLQGNFPAASLISLTPWEPNEVFCALSRSLVHRPAVIAPFVTRPKELVPDRQAMGLAPATAAVQGLYCLRRAQRQADIVLVLQGSGVTLTFVNQVLPRLLAQGRDPQVYYVSSAELFDLLPKKERERVYPADMAQLAMGITGFTLPTLYRWVTSALGRGSSLHPFVTGRYPGSGRGEQVLAQAGLDAEGQLRAIHDYRSALGQ